MDYLYETHMHTAEVSGCALSSAAQQIVTYKHLGYTGVIITDHFVNGYSRCPKNLPWDKKMRHFVFGYEEAKRAGEKYDVDVFLGWEFTIKGSDFLTYGLDLDFLLSHRGLDKLCIEDYSALVRENGGYIAQAHPYRDEFYIENKFPVDASLLDGIEVYNIMDKNIANAKALAFANEHDLPIQAGTDSHSTGNSFYSGIILRERAKNIHDIIKAIKMNDVTLI